MTTGLPPLISSPSRPPPKAMPQCRSSHSDDFSDIPAPSSRVVIRASNEVLVASTLAAACRAWCARVLACACWDRPLAPVAEYASSCLASAVWRSSVRPAIRPATSPIAPRPIPATAAYITGSVTVMPLTPAPG